MVTCLQDSVRRTRTADSPVLSAASAQSHLLTLSCYIRSSTRTISDRFIKREWQAVQDYLKAAAVLSIFGYSAPVTDQEAIGLLKQGWGAVDQRNLEQTEVINRPSANHEELRKTWDPFIHSHHYEICDSFYDSFLGIHPRRSVEAWWNQFLEVKWLMAHKVPTSFESFQDLMDWFQPLITAEVT